MRFLERRRDRGRRSGDGVMWDCVTASERLRRALGPEARLVRGIAPLFEVLDGYAQEKIQRGDGIFHLAVLWRGLVIDLTARQFDPDADLPLVMDLEEFKRRWSRGRILAPGDLIDSGDDEWWGAEEPEPLDDFLPGMACPVEGVPSFVRQRTKV